MDTEPQTDEPNSYYGLSRRPDLSPSPQPTAWPSARSPSANPQPLPSGFNFNRYAAYDPVTRQRTTAVDRNCTAPGCCVPKCFAEKGNRVRIFINIWEHKINISKSRSYIFCFVGFPRRTRTSRSKRAPGTRRRRRYSGPKRTKRSNGTSRTTRT